MLDYREYFFFNIVRSTLGYTPAIEIKPAHLANGLFRAICGGYINNESQHWAIYPKRYSRLVPDFRDPYQQKQWPQFTLRQQKALQFLDGKEKEREMLYLLLSADKTVFKSVRTSSYTLSHSSHVTNDNHDRDAGMWLYRILRQGEICPALNLLETLLQQEPRQCTDELSVLTLPFDDEEAQSKSYKEQLYKDWSPTSLEVDATGQFCDPIVQTIRNAFDQLAQNDAEIAERNGKLDTLRRFTVLACFSVYLHIINSGRQTPEKRIPILIRFDKSATTLQQASINSYQWALRSIDEFLRREITNFVERQAKEKKHGPWIKDDDIKKHITETINWYKFKSERGRTKEKTKVTNFKNDCWRFYCSYRGEVTNYSSVQAFANAATDMLGLVLSSKPQDIARALGTRIGLLGQSEGKNKKSYIPQPDFLEVMIRATIPIGKTWTLVELADHWAKNYGILFGGLGDENNRLQEWGITAVDRDELTANVNTLAILLEMSGYARRYADGVVLITVED